MMGRAQGHRAVRSYHLHLSNAAVCCQQLQTVWWRLCNRRIFIRQQLDSTHTVFHPAVWAPLVLGAGVGSGVGAWGLLELLYCVSGQTATAAEGALVKRGESIAVDIRLRRTCLMGE